VERGRWDEAEQLFGKVMETRKMKLGEDHSDTLTSIANLAFTWKYSGHVAETISLLRDFFVRKEKVLGPNHRSTLSGSTTLLE
jgi:hypothetical protein